MTTKQEIPSESIQQIIDILQKQKNNIILTNSVFGVAEAYLYEYKKQSDVNKIVTITEVHEIHSQKRLLDELDLSFYIESSLALNLCEQLMRRNVQIEELEIIRAKMQNNCERFQVGMEKDYKSNYQKGIYLNPILDYIKGKYDWEWLIANVDKPIQNADRIQKCMNQYIRLEKGPSRVILSAYDRDLIEKKFYKNFHVLNLEDKINYQRLKEEAIAMLYYLYPILWRHHSIIEKVLNHIELQEAYTMGEYTYEVFMNGLRKFYNAYHCVESSGCFISEDEFLSIIKDYINNEIHMNTLEQKKKSKLYI